MADSDLNGENAEREQDELFRVLTEHTNDFIRLHDLDGRSVYASSSVVRLYGHAPATLFEHVHPDDLEACQRWWERALAGSTERVHWRIRDAGGRWRWLETSAAVVRYHGSPHVLTVCRDITDKRQVEEESRKQTEVLQKIFDNAPVAINFFGEDGRLLLVNPAWERMFGWSRREVEEQKGDIYPEVIPDPQGEQRAREFVTAATGEWGDFKIRTRDGRTLDVLGTVVPLSDGTRIGLTYDVTQRKQAEDALRESERRLNEAQRIAHLGHWEHDLETGRIRASDETYRIFGLSPQEDLRTWAAWQEHLHPEDRPIRAAAIEQALREGPRYEAEYRVIRPDGGVRVIHSQGEVTRDEGGRPCRLFGIVWDITERRQAERALREAEQRLEHVVASSPAVLFTLRPEGGQFRGIGWMSANIESMLGYRVEETLGADWWLSNIHPEDRAAVMTPFLSEVLSRDHSSAEYRFRHKGGHYHWIRGESRLLRDPAGRPAEVVGSLSDITERKRLEDQFRQAQKMEAVGHLAGGVAHDFNNLLTIISGYSDILLPGLPPADPRRGMVAQIREAGERAAGLTRQLLAFSRQTVLEPKVLDLNDVVRENERMLRRLIGEDVQLSAALDPALEPVKVDPGQISQVVMNLAVNARDAMPTGGRLTIETGNVNLDDRSAVIDPEAKPGRYVLLAMTDTGCGMTPEVRARVFEPFFTTKGPGKGTGLGLATVYGIVKQSGGFISVYSELGRGTAFKIYFPIAPGRAPAGKSSAGLTPLARGTETILLVEDEDAVRSLIRMALQGAGYTVLDTSRGAEALRLAVAHPGPVHLLITDVVMPEMGGRELVERLAPRRPGLRVLYLSGYTDDAVVRHGVLQAEVAFLQKPFTMAALTNKVRQVLDEPPA